MLSPPRPKMPFEQRHVAMNIYDIPKGQIKLKDTSVIFQMTNDTTLGVLRTHAQKEYSKVLEMKSTYILNILALLLF